MTVSKPVMVTVGPSLAGERLDRVVALLLGVSRQAALECIERGDVSVNGQRVQKKSLRVLDADLVAAREVVAQAYEISAEVPSLIYFDRDLIAIDKPAGLLTHASGAREVRPTLVGGLRRAFPEIDRVGGDPLRSGIVHRLDRGTSGVMVAARSPRGYEALLVQVRAHSMRRRYLALVAGVVELDHATIDAPLGRSIEHRSRFGVVLGGRHAVTHYQRLAVDPTGTVTAVSVELDTGRTHQIRVHMAAIGHPIIGDALYEGPIEAGLDRPALHAGELILTHPTTGAVLRFTSPLPDDLRAVWERYGVTPCQPLDTGFPGISVS
ncbi:MAG: RluA family pseudouridine synthase [Ferrimicrobium sp.]